MSVRNSARGNRLAPGDLPLYSVSLAVDTDRVSKLSHTQGFDVDELLITRRGTKIPVMLKTRSQLVIIESASLVYDDSKSVPLTVENQKNQFSGVMLEVRKSVLC